MSPSNPASASASSLVDPALLTRTLSFILSLLPPSQTHPKNTPILVTLCAPQGAGKTTLSSSLSHHLLTYHQLPVLVLSIDDFYLTHADQRRLAASNPGNGLLQHRGEPGTHDVGLLRRWLGRVMGKSDAAAITYPFSVPSYDKSLHSGAGDRAPPSSWPVVHSAPAVILLEGWCVGFRPLSLSALAARQAQSPLTSTLRKHPLSSLEFINSTLQDYQFLLDWSSGFIHLDARKLGWVYDWRIEQERNLRAEKGAGMSDEEVKAFVDGYFPGYELYYKGVREGVFIPGGNREADRDGASGRKQLNIVVGKDRKLKEAMIIESLCDLSCII